MYGYSHLFNQSVEESNKVNPVEQDKIFRSFRIHNELYGYIHNGDTPPDEEAVSIAKNINSQLYDKYVDNLKNRKDLGFDGTTTVYAKFSNLDSRHIMMSMVLFDTLDKLGKSNTVENIIEIGGGFGGWLTLNNNVQQFKKWTIIDLPHIGLLQQWYLTNQSISNDHYRLVSATNYLDVVERDKIDVVIGSHSLSEFAFDVFYQYYTNVIKNSRFFFYAYHNRLPSVDLINTKLKIIENDFRLENKILSEQCNVSNCVYINKKYEH